MATDPAAIILCGGESRRMRTSKAWLAFGDETLLQRVVRLVSIAADPVVVVAAEGQDLPPLPANILVRRDAAIGRGPLQGFSAGLRALPETIELVYATATDVPFLKPAWIKKLVELSDDFDALIASSEGRLHPLAALYRRGPALIAVEKLLNQDRLRVLDLVSILKTNVVDGDVFRDVDPDLQTLRNLNTPEDHAQALASDMNQRIPFGPPLV